MTDTSWLEDRIADLETQLEAERDRRIEAERQYQEISAPAAILAVAEHLLREARIGGVEFWSVGVGVEYHVDDAKTLYTSCNTETLVEAYEAVRKEKGDG